MPKKSLPLVEGEHVYECPGTTGITFNNIFPVEALDKVWDFEFRPEDIIISSYSKTGTTWVQHISWMIMKDAEPTAALVPMRFRFPFIEVQIPGQPEAAIDVLNKMPPGGRMMKTHLPYVMFEKSLAKMGDNGPKIIVVIRNPKDVITSYYHFYRMNDNMHRRNMNWEQYFELYKAKMLQNGDFFEHTVDWWPRKGAPNMHFVLFEDLKEDPLGEITKMAKFLGKDLTDEQLQLIVHESSFEVMQTNPAVNKESMQGFHCDVSKFIRKGIVGDWQNHFSEKERKYVDDLCEELLTPIGLKLRDK